MEPQRRWLNPAQPQTLQIAVMLLYLSAAFGLFGMLVRGSLFPALVLIVAAQAAGAYGIANERRWGYWLALAAALLPFVLAFLLTGNPILAGDPLSLLFQIALVALLVHPQSRDYRRIWFR